MATKKRGRLQLEEVPVPTKALVTECGVETCPYGGRGSYYGSYGRPHSHFKYGDYQFAVMADEKIHEYDGPLFKWVSPDGRSSYGGNLQWDLPKDGQPGAWAEPDSKLLSTCNHGLHALLPGQRGFGGQGRLFVAESEGPVMFASGKVVTMRLRLVREVHLDAEISDELQAAHWRERSKQLAGRKPNSLWGYSYYFPPFARVLFKNTREATIRAARRMARPLLAEDNRLAKELARYDDGGWSRLRGTKPVTDSDWSKYHDLKRERAKVRRKLRILDQVVHNAQVDKLSWSTIPVEQIKDPDLALYMSKEVPDVDPPNS